MAKGHHRECAFLRSAKVRAADRKRWLLDRCYGIVYGFEMLEFIDKQPLFLYSFYYFGFNPEIMELNNWFIKSCTNNNILCLLRELLYTYWAENDRAKDYFLTQLFLTMAVEYYKEEYNRMDFIN